MSRSKEMDLTVGNPFRSLLKFAIPVILGNLFQLFYTLADSVIVGKTLGANSLGWQSVPPALSFILCSALSTGSPAASVSASGSAAVRRMKRACAKVSQFPRF